MGHGKTLNTIKEVDLKAFKEGRPVYYNNVTGLEPGKLQADWFEFEEPHKWFELPKDSIIVVDEAQQFFGTRDPRKDVPEYCSRFEVMRKQGHEVHLITQDPRFLDVHARRLCNKHIHYSRLFGSSQLVRYEAERCYETVDKFPSYQLADRSHIKLDKNYFGVYSSAQAKHHFKFKPSKKAIFVAFSFVAAAVLVYKVYDLVWSGKEVEEGEAKKPALAQVQEAIGASASSIFGTPEIERPVSTAEYLAERQPRISNIPSSAPVYDDLTAPKTHPRLFCTYSDDPDFIERTSHRVGVYAGKKTACVCYTQQVTKADVGFQFCMSAAKDGYFDNTRPDLQQVNANIGNLNQTGQQMAVQPSQGAAVQLDSFHQPAGSRVTVVPYQKGQFLW